MKARKLVSGLNMIDIHLLLQWGRADEGAETVAGNAPMAVNMLLQWGRADEGAETVG